jgi:hypothetical protein
MAIGNSGTQTNAGRGFQPRQADAGTRHVVVSNSLAKPLECASLLALSVKIRDEHMRSSRIESGSKLPHSQANFRRERRLLPSLEGAPGRAPRPFFL